MAFIYTLSDPRTDELRYVGKTQRKPKCRLRDHIKLAKYLRSHTASWIKSLTAAGVKPVMEVIEEVGDTSKLNEAEIFWISQFRALGFRLTNSTDGGDGLSLGFKQSEETRRKMSLAHKGKTIASKGRPLTKEHKKAISVGILANPANRNTPAVKEHCKKNGMLTAKVIVDQYGRVYSSVGEAAVALNLNRSGIGRVLSGKFKKTGGFVFRQVDKNYKEIK